MMHIIIYPGHLSLDVALQFVAIGVAIHDRRITIAGCRSDVWSRTTSYPVPDYEWCWPANTKLLYGDRILSTTTKNNFGQRVPTEIFLLAIEYWAIDWRDTHLSASKIFNAALCRGMPTTCSSELFDDPGWLLCLTFMLVNAS